MEVKSKVHCDWSIINKRKIGDYKTEIYLLQFLKHHLTDFADSVCTRVP